MTERPILFSAPMVRAILDGRKTQTRRVVKPQPVSGHRFEGTEKKQWCEGLPSCPYGASGDRLWVKETHSYWAHSVEAVGVEYAAGGEDKIVDFPGRVGMPSLDVQLRRRIGGERQKRPSIFMTRWASRITLEVEAVRVERLNDISDADAIAEGIERVPNGGWQDYSLHGGIFGPVPSYSSLWESINGPGSWAANPWVWVIQFRRVQP